jgi:hypothetical protein
MLWYYLRILVILFFGLSFFSDPVTANNVLEAQKLLTKLGYAPGPIDGAYGGKTKRALDEYYKAKNKQFDGKLDKNEILDLTASIKLIKTSRQKLKKSRHIQHARYSKHIATPFRDLKVSEDFTLIDDFETFMAFHESYLKGKLPDNRGFFNFRSNVQNIDFEFCVEDIIRTNRNKAKPTFGMTSASGYCGQMISQRFLNDTQSGIKNYRNIILGWLDNGIIHNPNVFSKKLPEKMMDVWPYSISSNVPQILSHYALYHKLYGFSSLIHQDIIKMGEAFYTQWDYYQPIIRGKPFKQKLCNLKSQYKVVVGSNDHCGSFTARMATGGIYFGLEFNSQLAFDTGIRHLEIMLATFNKDAVYAAQAQRGICALGYMKQFPPHFELIHYAFQKAYGIDFINTKNINGITPAEAYLKLWKIAHDPLETVVKYWNGFDQMGCSRNGKNQAAMVAQLKKDPSSYQDFWNGFSYEDFLLSSPILASQELPEEWKSLDNAKIKKGEGVLQTVAGGDWVGINPYLLQLALGNFEDIRREYDAERKKKEEKIRKRDKAERLRKREMLFSYDGIYKIQLGQDRNLIDGKTYQDFGSILFSLNRGQPNLDDNNILYKAFGLDEINFSLDYDGYMTVSGQILSNVDTERKCVYIAGNLKSDKKFNPKSSQNCIASGQNFSMKFKKISDDINFNFAQEEDLKELEGEYDVQWFITGINSTERSLYAKGILSLSNGVGVFSGNEEDKQPSSELRKELSVQYNANGDIVILGPLDLMEKLDVKQWHASGKIHPNEKTTIKTIWGLGDIIELEIEKSNGAETRKLIKENGREKKYVKTKHIQYSRFSKHIATPFRDLKVSEDFTLIDNFDSFMGSHESYLKGKLPDQNHPFSYRVEQGINFDKCVKDFIQTTSNKSNPTMPMHGVTAYCGNMISQRFLNNPETGIENYRKILLGWLENGIIENPNKFGKLLSEKVMREWTFGISNNVPNILTHYALYHQLYNFDQQIHQSILNMGEAFYTQWDYYPLIIRGSSFSQKLCNLKSQYKVVVGSNNHCGTFNASMATGGIYFGLEFNSQLAFDTGIRHLEIMLATFNKDGVFTAHAQRGICALGYMKEFTPQFELIHYAFSKAYRIDFINTKNINGVTPAQAYLRLWKIAHDPLETVVKYWQGYDQMGCSRNGKNQASMVAQLKKDPSTYKDFWNGFNYEDFLLKSPILAKQVLPHEWKEMDKSYVREGFVGEVVISGNHIVGISPYLLQLALGNFEDDRREYAEEFKRIKDEELKLAAEEFKRIKMKLKLEKAERLRKREMLFAYDGTYKVQLGLNRGTIDGQVYQDLGSILFTLNRGQPKLDENNILYQALGLNEINFSLDYDGYMIVSGKFLDEIKSERRCAYLAGNLKSDKKFNPKSSQNCGASGQSLSMRFEKISDDVNFDFVDEKELKKLDGEYDVQWFITNINTNERSLHAKDTLTLSNGIGVFEGNEPNKQPSSKLRKELSIQYNANGEIIILGKIDLFEKVDVKQWFASGKIYPMKKSKLKTIWGFGDIIELEIEKSKISEIPKVKEMKAEELIYGDDFIFNKKNNSFQLKRLDEIIKINQNDFSLNFDSNDEKFFDGDISYTTNANNFGTTWIGLKVKKTDEVSHNIKIAFQIEERNFPNFPEAFSTSKNECGVFEDMVDDSFIIPLKTDDLFELELFDCYLKVLQENLNDDDFGILKNRINTAISLVDTIKITNKYF